MSKDIVAYFDCDGVLVDYIEGFFNYCRTLGDPIPDNWKELHTDYDLFKTGWWVDIDLMFTRMHNYCYSLYWENPRALVAPDGFRELKRLGVQIHCITQVSDKGRWVARRRMLQTYFPDIFDSVSFTNFKESKIEYILERTDGVYETAVLIEDKLDTIEEAARSPIIPIMVDQPYNHTKVDPCTRVADCQGAVDVIKRLALTGGYHG